MTGTDSRLIARVVLAAWLAVALVAPAWAQGGDEGSGEEPVAPLQPEEAKTPAPATAPAPTPASTIPAAGTPPAPPAATPSAEQIMREMREQIDPNPLIEPTLSPDGAAPTATGSLDPAVVGTAPGVEPAKLRREGEFIVNRLGRLVRAPDGTRSLFSFEADAAASPEAPIVVLPCQILENMENLVAQRGDRVIFVISGQVTTYRGVNHLLPTMMKVAVNRGNLKN